MTDLPFHYQTIAIDLVSTVSHHEVITQKKKKKHFHFFEAK
jgi:hypothetical protein